MNGVDKYTRQCIKISVAHICQIIGWTSIQTTPLEILTDLLQEYLISLARMTNNYATHYGVSSPGVQHVGLSLKTIGISFNDLIEYMSAVEAIPLFDAPLYPLQRKNNLNLLKPGSREVVTRPVHIHEHLPPIHPNLQDEDVKEVLPTDVVQNDINTTPNNGQKNVFKKPGDPDNIFRRQRLPIEEEVRALREITSVMMTTSGFLSPAREGKLPEARTPLSSQSTMTTIIVPPIIVEKPEIPINNYNSNQPPKEGKKKKKLKEAKSKELQIEKNKIAKENKLKPSKITKNLNIDRSQSPNTSSKIEINSIPNTQNTKSVPRKQTSSPLTIQNATTIKTSRSPISDKILKTDINSDEIKFLGEKQKLNIFKKMSKGKDEIETNVETKEETEKWTGLDEVIDAVSRGNIEIKEEVDLTTTHETNTMKEEPEMHIDVVSIPNDKENFDQTAEQFIEVLRTPECSKKKKKEKSKDKHDGRHLGNMADQNILKIPFNDILHKSGKSIITSTSVDEITTKPNLISFPNTDLCNNHPSGNNMPTSFPFYQYPSGVLSHPLIPQGLPLLKPYPALNTGGPLEQTLSQQQPRISPTPIPVISSTSVTPVPPSTSVPPTTISSPTKKKEHKKIKKLKDKIKKKKGKKDKNRAKLLKSEKKRLKLEKKEREKQKLKSKKEKKEKKKDKEPNEQKHESPNVPKIRLKLSPASPQDNAVETCLRKIVIKPVVKKDENIDIITWPSTSINPTITNVTSTKIHKTMKHMKSNGAIPIGTNIIEDEPKVVPPSVTHSIQQVISHTINSITTYNSRVETQQSEYICPACNRPDDGSAMIACDSCDLWFHWICYGIEDPPESDWYCRKCTAEMDGRSSEKRKKHKKKKDNLK